MAEARFATPRTPDRATHGPAAARVAGALGYRLMPWQRQVLDVALEVDPATEQYAYGVVVVTVPRQSGKTLLVGAVATHRCLTLRRARAWITAQTGKDAGQWFRDEYLPVLEDSRLFQGKFVGRRSAGDTAVRWPALRSTFAPFAPQHDGLHGKQSDLVIIDEAWVHDAAKGAELRQAYRPTMVTRPGSQLWVPSTMGTHISVYLDEYVEAGRAAVSAGETGSGLAYFEWSLADDADAEDIDAVAAAHPAFGHTIQREALEVARAEFGTDTAGWARAYGNRRTLTRTAAFDPVLWARGGQETKPPYPKRVGIAYDVTPDGSRAAVGVAWRDDLGRPWVEVVHHGAGSAWVPALVTEIADRRSLPVGFDSTGPTNLTVAEQIARRAPHLTMKDTTTKAYAAACSAIAGAVVAGDLCHTRQPDLDAAVEVAGQRPIGDGGWGWGRRGSAGSIAPLVAVTLALRVFDDLPANTERFILRAAG